MARVNGECQRRDPVALVQFPLYPPLGEGQREPGWVWSKGKGEGFDPILEPCPSSRCTLPREKGNGSLPGYGWGKWRVSMTRYSCSCPVPVVPSLGRRATGSWVGMVQGEG